MRQPYSFLLILPVFFTCAVLYLLHAEENPEINISGQSSVNSVIGDESYTERFGELPGDYVPDKIRIETHLEYVKSKLKSRSVDHLTEHQKENRLQYLKFLQQYYKAGAFPYNDGHPEKRRPVFIDDKGNICAVGYLVEISLGREAAEEIGSRHKYDFIYDIDDPVFAEWVEESGFTVEELAKIQPMYGTIVTEEISKNRNKITLSYGAGSSLLAAANGIYLSNSSADPWLFESSAANHWFGLAAGSASVVLGAINLKNSRSYMESTGEVGVCWMTCSARRINETNHARTAVSGINIGLGLVSTVRAGYHLFASAGSAPSPGNTSRFNIIYLEVNPVESSETVPAMQMRLHF